MRDDTRKISLILSVLFISTIQAHDEELLCIRVLHGIECNGTFYEKEETRVSVGSPDFFVILLVCVVLILVAGTMSGLTIGIMALDVTTLNILVKSGTPEEKTQAAKILPLLQRHHLILVTLLLVNAAAMEALPIFLDKMVPGWLAIVISVTAVLFFGEIVPQSICARWGLAVGARASFLVWCFVILLFPFAWPISKILDLLLGHKNFTLLRRARSWFMVELKEFVNIHGEGTVQAMESLVNEERLSHDEVVIMKGALDLKNKTAEDAMTPLSSVFSLDIDTYLNSDTLKRIQDVGYSRIPLYRGHPSNIVGMLLVKMLVGCVDFIGSPLSKLDIKEVPFVKLDTPLYTLLNMFQVGHSHMATVVDCSNACYGIVTLEDVIEELIQEEIEDEKDFLMKTTRFEESPSIAQYNENLELYRYI